MDTVNNETGSFKIGLIGPLDSVTKILKAVENQYPLITFTPYVREEIIDAAKVFEHCQSENDGIFFTGVGVMEEVRKHCKITKSYDHIPRSGYSLMSAIWEMEQKNILYDRVSIDVVPNQVLREVMDEFNLTFDRIYTNPFSSNQTEENYARRHRTLYSDKEVDVILTGFGSIYRKLSDEGLPVIRLYPNAIQIRQHLDNLIHKLQSLHIQSSGIAIQIIRIKGITQQSLSQYDDLEKRGQFYLELLPYVKGVQGSLFAFGREEIIIYSTRGEIEDDSNRRLFRDLVSWSDKKNLNFYSGIGFGNTASDAEKSARKALSNARQMFVSGAYIVDGDQIRGPIGEADELEYFIRVADTEILTLSEKSGINAAYITKILAYIEKSGNDTFDSEELSRALNIGERTARRILKKLTNSGMGVLAAKENMQLRGRPKNLIRIEFKIK